MVRKYMWKCNSLVCFKQKSVFSKTQQKVAKHIYTSDNLTFISLNSFLIRLKCIVIGCCFQTYKRKGRAFVGSHSHNQNGQDGATELVEKEAKPEPGVWVETGSKIAGTGAHRSRNRSNGTSRLDGLNLRLGLGLWHERLDKWWTQVFGVAG